MECLENVKKFNPNFEIMDWCYEKLKSVEGVENYKFYNSEKEIKDYLVPVEKIVGTTHVKYIGRKWIDLPYKMKRFSDFYNVNNFLNFTETENFTKSGIYYIKYGDLYFTGAGNHRTCQAKFSNLMHIKTDLIEYIFDFKMFQIFNFLTNENLMPIIKEGGYGKYYRFSSWKIYVNSKEYFFQSFEAIEKFVKYYKDYSPSFFNNIIARLSKQEIFFSYNEQKDYTHLKNAIILHKLNNKKQPPF